MEQDASRWLSVKALPLWASNGFDRAREAFEEQLDFDGTPVATVPRRVMVQARQISVYAAAALAGIYPGGGEQALRAAHAMMRTYREADGAPGWVFSVDRTGRVVDGKRDLYAHAFVVFGLAWAMRLERDRRMVHAVADTLKVLDRHFADAAHGGYWDCLPRPDALRRQNPHMHLFEALLALAETSGGDEALARCDKLRALAIDRFLDRESGMIREHFDERWNVHPEPGRGSVEPGHLFEWAWLLRRYETATGYNQDEPVSRLIDAGLRYGLDEERGRIVDEIAEDGSARSASSRSWPHAEALKALSAEASRSSAAASRLLAPILRRLRSVYCEDRLQGGWIDHVDAKDGPISAVMPASSLYHLYFGMSAVRDLVRSSSGS